MRIALTILLLTALAGTAHAVVLTDWGPASSDASSALHAASADAFELVLTVPQGTEDVLKPRGLRNAAAAWLDLIGSAHERMDCAFFYVSSIPHHALSPVLDALASAAQRGVHIRFIFDKTMRKVTRGDDTEGMRRILALPNTEVRLVDYGKVGGGVHHAKYIIVDGARAFLGSNNFDWRSLEAIHELGVVTHDRTVVRDLERLFANDWELPHRVPKPREAQGTFDALQMHRAVPHIVASPLAQNPEGIPGAEQELVWLINSSRTSLAIELMTYALRRGKHDVYRTIDDALRAAAARGVTVQLLVESQRAARHHTDLCALAAAGVAVRVVTIPSAKKRDPYSRLIHAKYMVVDTTTLWLGSSNWERDYFHRSRNVELVLPNTQLPLTVFYIHRDVWDSPYAADIRTVASCAP